MKVPAKVKKTFTFVPGFHLCALRHMEGMMETLLKDHPSPNQKNTPGVSGEFADNIAENYESFLSLKAMISEVADDCDTAVTAASA